MSVMSVAMISMGLHGSDVRGNYRISISRPSAVRPHDLIPWYGIVHTRPYLTKRTGQGQRHRKLSQRPLDDESGRPPVVGAESADQAQERKTLSRIFFF